MGRCDSSESLRMDSEAASNDRDAQLAHYLATGALANELSDCIVWVVETRLAIVEAPLSCEPSRSSCIWASRYGS